jgi:hypothetical protein
MDNACLTVASVSRCSVATYKSILNGNHSDCDSLDTILAMLTLICYGPIAYDSLINPKGVRSCESLRFFSVVSRH